MKLQFWAIAVLLTGVFSFTKKKKDSFPPGLVAIGNGVFADKTEMNNIGWREFEFWLLAIKQDTALFEQMLPDTTVWEQPGVGGGLSFTSYYYRHPSYNNYPVVGISYKQAIAYCDWRSDMVNEYYSRHPSSNPIAGKKYRYRLPTLKEWELMAANKKDINIFPFGVDSTHTKWHGKWVKSFNCKYDTAVAYAGSLNDRVALTATVNAYSDNAYGIYNLIGNVSEMTNTEGIAKGGNYTLPVNDCTITASQTYTTATSWLGFRCVCEIVNE